MEIKRDKWLISGENVEKNSIQWKSGAEAMEGKEAQRGMEMETMEEKEARWEGKAEAMEEKEAQWEGKAEAVEEKDIQWGKKVETMEKKDAQWERETENMEGKEVQWKRKTEIVEEKEKVKGKWEKDEKSKEEFEYDEINVDKGHRKRKYRMTGSMAVKIAAFFVLALSCFAGACGICVSAFMYVSEAYTLGLHGVMLNGMRIESGNVIQRVQYQLALGNADAAEEICRQYNIDLTLLWGNADGSGKEVLWSTWNGYDTDLEWITPVYFDSRVQIRNVVLNGHALQPYEEYLWHVQIDPQFPKEDNFKMVAKIIPSLYYAKADFIIIGVCGMLLALVCFVFLMCGAGHRAGYGGIVPGVLTAMHLEILIVLFGGVSAILIRLMREMINFDESWLLAVLLGITVATFLVFWWTLFLTDIAIRFKMRKIWQSSLMFVICTWMGRLLLALCRGLVYLINHIPSIMLTVCICLGACIYEFLTIMAYWEETRVFLWGMEKVILLPLVLYIALSCKRLLKASEALAEGQEDYAVDTSKMFGDFKRHGEHLNSLGRGISKAVAERMKSEHLKTELITNVSHDLKTPLTSIINYADLICEEVANASRKGISEKGTLGDRISEKETSGEGGFGEGSSEDGMLGEETSGEGISGKGISGEQVSGKETSGEYILGDGQSKERAPGMDHAKIGEYAEVLLRQSRRLKKLLEDLVEASKATTGNLEVNLEPCEAGVILSQAVGEYEKRMEEKGLKLITRQPEEPVNIIADGRHLWRVFDNLLNNICKYAQENSRVYLSVETREENVLIIFRNMSKYPLEVSADELQERFVRGDKSRHMEGNGLGLSIAGSLIELQNGKMDIVTDGDLFKVILCFARDYAS